MTNMASVLYHQEEEEKKDGFTLPSTGTEGSTDAAAKPVATASDKPVSTDAAVKSVATTTATQPTVDVGKFANIPNVAAPTAMPEQDKTVVARQAREKLKSSLADHTWSLFQEVRKNPHRGQPFGGPENKSLLTNPAVQTMRGVVDKPLGEFASMAAQNMGKYSDKVIGEKQFYEKELPTIPKEDADKWAEKYERDPVATSIDFKKAKGEVDETPPATKVRQGLLALQSVGEELKNHELAAKKVPTDGFFKKADEIEVGTWKDRKALLLAEKAAYAIQVGNSMKELGLGLEKSTDPSLQNMPPEQALVVRLILGTGGEEDQAFLDGLLARLGPDVDIEVDQGEEDFGLDDYYGEDLGLDDGGMGAGAGGGGMAGDQTLYSESTQPTSLQAPGYQEDMYNTANNPVKELWAEKAYAPHLYDTVANANKRGQLIQEKEQQAKAYNQQFAELMRKSENKALTHNLIEGLGSIVSGLVGLTTDLNVSANYKMNELQEPDEYFKQAAPVLQSAYEKTTQELDNMIAFYAKEGEEHKARMAAAVAAVQQAKIAGATADINYLSIVSNIQESVMRGDLEAQKLSGASSEAYKRIQAEYQANKEELTAWGDATAKENTDYMNFNRNLYQTTSETLGKSNALPSMQNPEQAANYLGSIGLGADAGRIASVASRVATSSEPPMKYSDALKLVLDEHSALFNSQVPNNTIHSITRGTWTQKNQDELNKWFDREISLYGEHRSGLTPESIQRALNLSHIAERNRTQQTNELNKGVNQSFYSGTEYAPNTSNTPLNTEPITANPEVIAQRLGGREHFSRFVPPDRLPKTGERGQWRGFNTETAHAAGLTKDSAKGQLPDIAKTTPYLQSVATIAKNVGITPNELLNIIDLETSGTFNPRIVNHKSGATGLIQFMPTTAKGLISKDKKVQEALIQAGYDPGVLNQLINNNPQALMASMPASMQFSLVNSYFAERAKSLRETASTLPDGQLTGGWVYTTVLMGNPRASWAPKSVEALQNSGLVAKVAKYHKANPETFTMTAAHLASYFDVVYNKDFIGNLNKGAN